MSNSETKSIAKASFNREAFYANFSGLEDVAMETIKIFIKSVPDLMLSIQTSIQEKKDADLELHAHSLKGSVSNFFAEPSRELAFSLEKMGKAQDMTKVESVFKELKIEIDRLVLDLKTELK